MVSDAQGTALITGASSGIGASFARQLAAQGYQLILVARRMDRLQSLRDDLQKRYSICAEAVSADLSDQADLERLERRIVQQNDLALLINNAGFGTVGSFVEVPLERHLQMIDVHVSATVRLCYAALPGMIRRKQGAIINVSSLASFLPASVGYSASKAYLNVFSEALQVELKGTGVRIQALCPGFTHTEFHASPEFQASRARMAPEAFWMSSDDVVATSLRALGRGSVIVIPGWKNRMMAAFMRSAFAPLTMRMMSARAPEPQ